MKRSLDEKFIDDLMNGKLKDLLKRIKEDSTLDLQFRGNYIDVYYRGGRILHLTKNTNGYITEIDENYFKGQEIEFKKDDIESWLANLPEIKQARDFHYTLHTSTTEREFQQLITRTNNYERTSNSTDFFITDMEYSFNIGTNKKIDLIGIEWRSNQRSKNGLNTKFAFIEVKFGNDAVKGTSGLEDHLNDIQEYLTNHQSKYKELRDDTLEVFKQKRALGLYRFDKKGNPNEITKIDEKPYFIIILADYKNTSNNLYKLIEKIDLEKYEKDFDLRFSVSSFMGYGLYSDCLLTKAQILQHIKSISSAKN